MNWEQKTLPEWANEKIRAVRGASYASEYGPAVERLFEYNATISFVSDFAGLLIEEIERLRAELADLNDKRMSAESRLDAARQRADILEAELAECREKLTATKLRKPPEPSDDLGVTLLEAAASRLIDKILLDPSGRWSSWRGRDRNVAHGPDIRTAAPTIRAVLKPEPPKTTAAEVRAALERMHPVYRDSDDYRILSVAVEALEVGVMSDERPMVCDECRKAMPDLNWNGPCIHARQGDIAKMVREIERLTAENREIRGVANVLAGRLAEYTGGTVPGELRSAANPKPEEL